MNSKKEDGSANEVNNDKTDERKGMLKKHNPDKRLNQHEPPTIEKEALDTNKKGNEMGP
ncbi:hypothetical protein [Olivibacter sp. XZL3]|uniref:hypothetical protein n=1 Tax=Olivibacter sp. XZL3 TaxID=1735116 RepID=UPI001416F790|nr:hypothetical protein [Olivibacter sp. XZL3]